MGTKGSSKVEDLRADIIIIGGGGAGLPAAAAAIEAGAKKVIILDKREILGGCARMAKGFFAVESPAQKRLGIHHTADECFTEHMEQASWTCDARLVRAWLNGSKDIVRWFEEKGVVIDDVTAFTGTKRFYHRVADKPTMTGNTIMDMLVKDCKKKGVQVIMETRVRRLLTDAKGNVTGVLADQKGKDLRIAAKSVIIATGSITRNEELLKRYYPEVSFENIKLIPLPHSTGDGLLLAEEIGAAKDGFVTTLWIGPHNHPHNVRVGLVSRRPHMILVNKYGVRYADETLYSKHQWGWFAGNALERQPGRICYALMDEKIKRDMIRKREIVSGLEDSQGRLASGDFLARADQETGAEVAHDDGLAWLDELEDDIQSEIKQGRVKASDTWDEIAEWMGADPAVLKATVDRYNVFCKNSYDADFLKSKEWLLPLRTPPYYAILAHQGVDACIGGIRISHRMEVLDKELRPIGGLYAAGVATSGWLGPAGYSFSGSELGFSLFSGYTAAKIAAAYAKSDSK